MFAGKPTAAWIERAAKQTRTNDTVALAHSLPHYPVVLQQNAHVYTMIKGTCKERTDAGTNVRLSRIVSKTWTNHLCFECCKKTERNVMLLELYICMIITGTGCL
jgi:hypothetical protein